VEICARVVNCVLLIKLGRTRYEKKGVGAFNVIQCYVIIVRVEVDLEKTFPYTVLMQK